MHYYYYYFLMCIYALLLLLYLKITYINQPYILKKKPHMSKSLILSRFLELSRILTTEFF